MKFEVHCPPSVSVWTPGWMVALSAGAHAEAVDGTSAMAAIAANRASARRYVT